MLRQFRRAPGRIVASVLALALAVGAIGVLAIPSISEGSLRDAVGRDGLADIIVDTTDLDAEQVAAVGRIAGVDRAEGQVDAAVRLDDGFLTRMIGLGFPDQTMDVVQLEAGRLPRAAGEVVTSPSVAGIGDTVVANGVAHHVVGHGSTLWWSSDDVLFATVDTAAALDDGDGFDRLVVTAVDDGEEQLRSITDEIRDVLAADGDTFTTFPVLMPDGSTPIDADIDQISTLIGLLGVFAGLVALVLLASTTSTLITERSREVAVMRALGGRERQLRRRLRRIAVGITAVALLVGLPLGVLISNLIARMVLEEFVGLTPDLAVDWKVLVLSAAGALVGARLVSARAARRVVRQPLAEALRDRSGRPFGRRWSQRLAARIPTGGLLGRMSVRASLHRTGRTVTVIAQIAAAVGAAFLIPSLTTSVNGFNSGSSAPWSWESVTVARDPGLPFEQSVVDGRDDAEAGIWTSGEIAEWEIDVFGLPHETALFDPMLSAGSWIAPGSRDAVLSAGFAERNAIRVGDRVVVELAGGSAMYDVVGVSDDFGRAIYVDRSTLASDIGSPGAANTVWSTQESPGLRFGVATRTTTASDLAADDEAGREAVVFIFGAIGVIVASVAGLAVLSSMTVSLYERRHELAALQAVGARRRRLRGLVLRELLPVGALGTLAGLGLGALGTRAIIGSFESSNAIDIGVVDAVGAVPFIAVGTLASLVLLTWAVVRAATRRPVATTLRGAA